ncbi:MAG TPA: alpha/beta hydrolase-fold protein [Candidatus Binatus sp.]|nr:alpha/beta hydrolase-fold protein [Candidatus Binatus sp.]
MGLSSTTERSSMSEAPPATPETAAGPGRLRTRSLALGRRLAVPAVVIAVALAVGGLADASGNVAGAVATLIVIGFSPDRSQLIATLTVEAVAVAIGAAVAPRRWALITAGLAVVALLYHHTFDAETRAAVAASGAAGRFDPLGWALTLATLVVTATLIAWAVTILVAIARAEVGRAISDLRSIRSAGLGRRTLGRPTRVAVVAVALALTMPLLGDMLNYEPDVAMRAGAPVAVGLAGSGPDASLPPGTPYIAPSLLVGGGVIAPSAEPGGTPPVAVLSTARPWLRWVPTGSGTLIHQVVPAPFGPSGATTILDVFLPPGYETSTRHYPVLYEAPWSVITWQKGLDFVAMLSALIDGGEMPPAIVVFVRENGGPYADTECANTLDGKVWYQRWFVQTVVPTVDQTYRTISTAAARGIFGFSQGGFCSTMFLLRDPTVFGTAISFSGYFEAGIRASQTVNAWIPFGGDPAYEQQFSPIDLASTVPPALRPLLFVELSANPVAALYGPQYVAFSRVLDGAGIPLALFPTPLGHAWAAIRDQLPQMLTDWGERMTMLSVFA